MNLPSPLAPLAPPVLIVANARPGVPRLMSRQRGGLLMLRAITSQVRRSLPSRRLARSVARRQAALLDDSQMNAPCL